VTAIRDLTPYCAAPACDLNLAGWAHVPWDCDTLLPAPTMDAATVAALPAERRPWVQGSARAFARLNPGVCPPREPGEELPGELATDPRQQARLRQQETTAAIGERAEAGLHAENAASDPARRRAAIADRVGIARLRALDRDLLLANPARLPEGSPDLSQRSVLDARFHAFLLSDHLAAVAERCRRRDAYLDDTAREREGLLGWLAKLDATPLRPGDLFDDSARRMAAITRRLLHEQAARLAAELGEPDSVRVARAREDFEAQRRAHGHRAWRYPARYRGRSAARQPIPPEHPSRAGRATRTSYRGRQGRPGRPVREAGHER
jgi:hypothetical protein